MATERRLHTYIYIAIGRYLKTICTHTACDLIYITHTPTYMYTRNEKKNAARKYNFIIVLRAIRL